MPLGIPLTDRVWVAARTVDAIELSWTVPTRFALASDPPDQLEQALTSLRQGSKELGHRTESGWHFDDHHGPDPLMVHERELLGSPFALQCASFLIRINHASSSRPRAVLQLRPALLIRLGAVEAYRQVTAWVDSNLLPLVDGQIPGTEPTWRVFRLDLATDVVGAGLTRHHLPRFAARSRQRREHERASDEGSMALDGRQLTGFTFGARGQSLYCRIYDKGRQAEPAAPIRTVWAEAGYQPAAHGTVWRIEFEFRGVLRDLRTDEDWISRDPEELLSCHLTDLWGYATRRWLALRAADPSRDRRAKVEGWWHRLAELDFLDSPAGLQMELRRERRPGTNPTRLLASLCGTVTSAAAAWRIRDIDAACNAVARHLHVSAGPQVFARRVLEREHRWPVPLDAPPALPTPPQRGTRPSIWRQALARTLSLLGVVRGPGCRSSSERGAS